MIKITKHPFISQEIMAKDQKQMAVAAEASSSAGETGDVGKDRSGQEIRHGELLLDDLGQVELGLGEGVGINIREAAEQSAQKS